MVGPPPRARALVPAETSEAGTKAAIRLSLDEVEALRLADLESMYQEQAAEAMSVSRSTYGRILESARHKLTLALWEARPLLVEGGDVCRREMTAVDLDATCARPGGSCICPECGWRTEHQPGVPCRRQRCPHCDVSLMREGGERHRRSSCC